MLTEEDPVALVDDPVAAEDDSVALEDEGTGTLALGLVADEGPPGTVTLALALEAVLDLVTTGTPGEVALEELTTAAELEEVVVAVAAGGVASYLLVVGRGLGGTVVEGLPQSKVMEWKPKWHVSLGTAGCLGTTMVTFLAPPHWLFSTVVPDFLQAWRCLHTEPSGMS